MSGRAGRRGLDDRGIVILMIDEKMSPGVGKNILQVRPGVRAVGGCLLWRVENPPYHFSATIKIERKREHREKGKWGGKKKNVGKVKVCSHYTAIALCCCTAYLCDVTALLC